MNTYKIGELAYIDSFNGMIPCKTIRRGDEPRSIVVKPTVTRAGYYKGEQVVVHASLVIPRKQLITRNGQYRIKTDYKWL